MKNPLNKLNNQIYEIQKEMLEIERKIFELNEKKKEIQKEIENKKIVTQETALKAYKKGLLKNTKEVDLFVRKKVKADTVQIEKQIEDLEKLIFELNIKKQMMKIESEKLLRDFQIKMQNYFIFTNN